MSKQHKYHYIYKTTCNITNRYYIGMHSTSNLGDGYIGSGRRLWLSINKHGKDNHSIEILEWLPDRSSLKSREKELVNESLLNDPLCMNLQLGGGGGLCGESHHLKMRKGSSIWIKKKWEDPNYRMMQRSIQSKQLTDLHKIGRIKYDTFTNKSHSKETKDKIGKANSVNQLGEKNSQYGTVWIQKNNISKKVKSTELSFYLADGWIKGRKIR